MGNIPNLESVFGANKQQKKNEIISEQITNINISDLVSFKEHIFNEISENKFEELVQSIKQNDVLVPIIVRKIDNEKFEIIAGHNRVRACKILQLSTIPAIIKNADDDTAKIIMIDTNVSQRDKLLPSELMRAYSLKQKILKQKLLDQVEKNEANTSGTYDTRQKLAEQENVSATQISRYIRLKELIQELLDYVDSERLAFNVGVTLSFLKKENQEILLEILKDNPKLRVSLKQAEKLKTTKADLTKDYIFNVLNNSDSKKTIKFTGKIKTPLVKKYKDKFKSDEEFTNLIELLLENYFNNNQEMSDKSQT